MLTAAQANFAPASGGGAGAAGGTGAAGGAVAGLAAASSDAERMIIVKTMLDPPDATLQTAMWAAARATPDIVSVEETKLRATYVAGGSTDEEFTFRFKLAQIRELYPPVPAMKYIGRNIISSNHILRIRVDNEPVCMMINKFSTRSAACLPILQELCWLCAIYAVELEVDWIDTKSNVFPDLLSRRFSPGFDQAEWDELRGFPTLPHLF